ncbi:hypothetical protein [Leadbettera azotonutricia]|uniref:Uncharacterized protein n=1 Tax=Leadbettera azotonutricia (strain ATCC BAA-888 / DSM 13862 / ZAS-9) TaxID=545695 RepID=F5YEU1_LEAAZ|nr:hypothetical protein [Leadbettera azotonutricia]AEF83048.1 conserved hypothetical protein [Leadbettera azotonutricia ZAS-9]
MPWPYLAAICCLILCVFTFFYCHFYIKRRTSRDSILGEIQDEVDSILFRINEITDRDITLLEDREKSLQALLDDADRRLKVYARELDRHENSGKAYQALGLRMQRNGKAADSDLPVPPQTVPAAEAIPLPAAEPPRFAQAEKQIEAEPRPIGEQVRDLSLAGFSAPLIASKLGISISEAELAMALLERKPLE